MNLSIVSILGKRRLNVLALFAKSRSVVYMVTSLSILDVSLAMSTQRNMIPPNCVAGNEAGQTSAIFIFDCLVICPLVSFYQTYIVSLYQQIYLKLPQDIIYI